MVLTLAALLLSGCKSRAVEEAREVIAVADSLRAEGQGYTDSVAIAEAYNTLEKWQYIYPTDYVHACYHYGRLLRNNDDPVAAMQVFINGTHSSSKDYHILGRIYSNMGDIAHLAGEYSLSYNMFERSADMFLKNADTLLYYYLLNDMAVELAVQGDEINTKPLLFTIRQLKNNDIYIKTLETEALLFQYQKKYNLVVQIVDSAKSLGYHELLGEVLKARAYSYLNQLDSALFYARKVVEETQNPAYLIDTYYILSHNDSSISTDSVLSITSQRADIQKKWGIGKGKLSQATQLLVQDLNRKPDLRWLYVVIGVLLLICSCSILYYIWRKRKQHQQIIVDLQEKEIIQGQLEQSITNLSKIQDSKHEQMNEEIEHSCQLFRESSDIKADLCWKDYKKLCDILNQQFYLFALKLQQLDEINERDIRLCALVLLDLSHATIADLMYVEENSVGKLKERTAKKLRTSRKNMRQVLINIIWGDN